jgi:pentatricopeptide repeat protein
MDIHAKKGLVDECLKIYYESQKYPNCKFDESLMSAALRACCNMRCIEKAEDLIKAAEAEGIVVPLACYNWLILGTQHSRPCFPVPTVSPTLSGILRWIVCQITSH